MKIALAILHAVASRGGAERYTRDLAAHLHSFGIDVLTLATSFDPDWPGETLLIPAPGLTRSARYHAFTQNLTSALASRPGHILHAMLPVPGAHLYHPHAGIAAESKRPLVLDSFNRRRAAFARVERLSLSSPHPPLSLALSNYVLQSFRRHYPTAPATVLLNGVNLDRFDPALFGSHRAPLRGQWNLAPTDVALLCVAQDFARKGVPQAIESLAQGPQNTKLIVLGRDDPASARKLAARLAVSHRVLFPGPSPDVRPAYAAADIFLLPTSHDPCPLVTIEALAMGLPVISTTSNGATEYMSPGLHGEILPGQDSALLATAVTKWADPARRAAATPHIQALRPTLDVSRHYAVLGALYRTFAANCPVTASTDR